MGYSTLRKVRPTTLVCDKDRGVLVSPNKRRESRKTPQERNRKPSKECVSVTTRLMSSPLKMCRDLERRPQGEKKRDHETGHLRSKELEGPTG